MTAIRPLSSYALVVWDWNGTLLDDLALALDVANGMLARRGRPTMDATRYRDIFDFPVSEYYRRAGFDFEAEPFSILADEFIGEYNRRVRECSLHADAADVLAAIAATSTRQAILSASEAESLAAAVAGYGIGGFFERLQGLDDHFAVSKRGAGQRLLDDLSITPADAVIIGDTTHDYEVAGELGMDVVLVAAGHQSRRRLSITGAFVVDSIGDIAV